MYYKKTSNKETTREKRDLPQRHPFFHSTPQLGTFTKPSLHWRRLMMVLLGILRRQMRLQTVVHLWLIVAAQLRLLLRLIERFCDWRIRFRELFVY